MNKDVTICFRTSEELRSALQKIAAEDRRTVSSLIESIAYGYLRERKELKTVKNERRQYNRKKLSVPALVQKSSSEEKRLQAGLILDISPGGLQISIPKGYEFSIRENEETSRLEIIFTLPSSKRPLTMQCIPRRVDDAREEEVTIGASFSDADFASFQALQTYLLH